MKQFNRLSSVTALPWKSSFQSASLFLNKINKLFVFTVIIPTLLSIFYFGFLASDVYVSESRFIVRRAGQPPVNLGLSALLSSTPLSKAEEADYSIHDYILSRDALSELNDRLNLKKLYSDHKIDWFHRFALLGVDSSFESLYRYYKNRINIVIDSSSSISTLQVRAFTAKDAYQMNQYLLELAEQFINRFNIQSRKDYVDFAKAEVDAAIQKAKEASLALSDYRGFQGVFDPNRESAMRLQHVSKMEAELVAAKGQLAQIKSLAPRNPYLSSLRKNIETLRLSINTEKNKVTGNLTSLTNKVRRYERLVLNKKFAYKQLVFALSSLKKAQIEAQRKQLYLEMIAHPNEPDNSFEPNRSRNIFSIFILGLITWGVLSLLIANVKEHLE
ncbi:sugar transporter [Legionella sp. WA2024007413]